MNTVKILYSIRRGLQWSKQPVYEEGVNQIVTPNEYLNPDPQFQTFLAHNFWICEWGGEGRN